MNEHAKRRLAEIMGPPLLVASELRGGELVTIYPLCDKQALARFLKNHGIEQQGSPERIR